MKNLILLSCLIAALSLFGKSTKKSLPKNNYNSYNFEPLTGLNLNEIEIGGDYELKIVKENRNTYAFYYQNGQLQSRRTYTRSGKLIGDIDFFTEEGKIKLSATYAKNSRTFMFYSPNGKLVSYGSMNAKNQRTGTWVYFAENGDLAKTIRYTYNGLPLIEKEFYGEEYWSRIKSKIQYSYGSDGSSSAQYISYHNNGYLDQYGHYKNGKPSGSWYKYNYGIVVGVTNYN